MASTLLAAAAAAPPVCADLPHLFVPLVRRVGMAAAAAAAVPISSCMGVAVCCVAMAAAAAAAARRACGRAGPAASAQLSASGVVEGQGSPSSIAPPAALAAPLLLWLRVRKGMIVCMRMRMGMAVPMVVAILVM